MENRADYRAGGSGWWTNPWLRAALLHPVLFVLPWVVICLVLAWLPGSEFTDVDWGFRVIPLSAVAGFLTTVVMAARSPRPGSRQALIVCVGLIAGVVALICGMYGWLLAAETACHDTYECPI
jgi:hypothetical protein